MNILSNTMEINTEAFFVTSSLFYFDKNYTFATEIILFTMSI